MRRIAPDGTRVVTTPRLTRRGRRDSRWLAVLALTTAPLGGCEKSLRPGGEIEVGASDELTLEIARDGEYWLDIAQPLSPRVRGVGRSALRPGTGEPAPSYWFGYLPSGRHEVVVDVPDGAPTGSSPIPGGRTTASLLRLPRCSPAGRLTPGQPRTTTQPPAARSDPRGSCSEVVLTIARTGSYSFRSRVEHVTNRDLVREALAAYLVDARGVTVAPALAFEPASTEVRLAPATYRLRLLNAGDRPMSVTHTVDEGRVLPSPSASPSTDTAR